MLKIKDIKKTYKVGNFEQHALKGVSLEFRENEFVAVLGSSGSGKTTLLNIIGGLDRYDSGDLIINNKSTKNFKNSDWDAYRNSSIGFVFQSYNLINHITVLDNVEMALTLSGVKASERKSKALEVLEKVGLKDHVYKKPNQLSGGQMQRVAIARALVNNPDIILADEPTGALDTKTSIQIMELISEISKDKLVIMVTHNPELAENYAKRIIELKDGNIISDTNPVKIAEKKDSKFVFKKTSMSFLTALKLSFNNIKTKKGRTMLTAIASSIGIIGIAVILSLSNGFQKQIDSFQNDAMKEFPIIISQNAMNLDKDSMTNISDEMNSKMGKNKQQVNSDEVFLYNSKDSTIKHINNFTKEYIDYVENIDPSISSNIGYTRLVKMNLVRKIDGKVLPVSITSGIAGMTNQSSASSMQSNNMGNMGSSSYPIQLTKENVSYLEKNYDVLYGYYPKNENDLVLVVDNKNRVDIDVLKNLGFKTDDVTSIKFSDIAGTEFKLILNNDYYTKTKFGTYIPSDDYKKMYGSKDSITLKISGIVRQKSDSSVGLLSPGLAYSDNLSSKIIQYNKNSDIVKAQEKVNYNVITKQNMSQDDKNSFLSILGGNETPFMIMIYPNGFSGKDKVTNYLDNYNADKSKEDKVIYTDLAETISTMTSGIMNGITLVLIAFAAISLVVSLIMIAIITYISVLERTKEIGILKALGARKKDITRVFSAETFILGLFSGILGVVIAYAATFPINNIIYKHTELSNVAHLKLIHAVLLVIISTILTMIGGYIPSRMAAKKDAVEALRTE